MFFVQLKTQNALCAVLNADLWMACHSDTSVIGIIK